MSCTVSIPQAVWIACNVQSLVDEGAEMRVSIPQAVWIACNHDEGWGSYPSEAEFQYRKRYGLHAIYAEFHGIDVSFSKFQYRKRYGLHAIACILIQASQNDLFQYRKRYGLHAIPSLTALGTAEPRSGFSKRIALFGKSPQPRGIFLSPKSAENVRKPCDTKETFVHGKNLKLMAFFREFLPSL